TVLISVLYLACTIAQPTAGKLSEVIGPRPVLLGGTIVVLVGGILGGVATSLALLIVSRVLIGIGTSVGYPSAMVLVRRRAAQAGMVQPPSGVLGALAMVGLVLISVGPPIGGALIGGFGWRATFFVNVPVALLTLSMAIARVPKDAGNIGLSFRELATRTDLPGIVAFAGAMTSLLIFLLSLPNPHWVPLALAVGLASVLCWWELRMGSPFIDVRQLVSNGALTRTYLRSGLTMLGAFIILYGLPEWVEASKRYSPAKAGLMIVPMGVMSAAVSQVVARRRGLRGSLISCGVAMLLGCAGMAALTSTSSPLLIIAVTLLFGVALGTTSTANQTALYLQALPEQLGTASGLFRTFVYLGSIAAATLTGVVFRNHVTDHGLHTIAYLLSAISAVVLIMAVADRRLRGATQPPSLAAESHIDKRNSMTDRTVDPLRTALLVLDYQPGVIDSLGPLVDTSALLDRVAGAIGAARDAGASIGFVRSAFADEDFAAISSSNKVFEPIAQARALSAENPPWRVLDERPGPSVARSRHSDVPTSRDPQQGCTSYRP
ncbi:MAG TPA: MFS transporter, partial [Galbitalea sp.]|nr:MFS transporter [Galbitalea sp.]